MNNDIEVPEKFYIYLLPSFKQKLEDDARQFDFLKKDNKVNMNDFLNKLVNGYYEQFNSEEYNNKKAILNILKRFNVPEEEKQSIADEILQKSNSVLSASSDEKRKRVMLRPAKEYLPLYKKIVVSHANLDGMSLYFAKMIMSYFELPMSERELIIFKDKYDKILYASTLDSNSCPKTRLAIHTKGNLNAHYEVIPYKVVVGKEEMFNYLLCARIDPITGKQSPMPFHLCRLDDIRMIPGDTSIDKSIKQSLDKMAQFGPQYVIEDNIEACVRLTDKGVLDFKRIYFGRPIRLENEDKHKEDGYYYYFNCSLDQLFLYFRRFGCEAEIMYPESLRLRIKDFHEKASAVYEKG